MLNRHNWAWPSVKWWYQQSTIWSSLIYAGVSVERLLLLVRLTSNFLSSLVQRFHTPCNLSLDEQSNPTVTASSIDPRDSFNLLHLLLQGSVNGLDSLVLITWSLHPSLHLLNKHPSLHPSLHPTVHPRLQCILFFLGCLKPLFKPQVAKVECIEHHVGRCWRRWVCV